MQTTKSALHRWLIVIAVMSATFIQVLDSTIVNVALPHMQGSLGIPPDTATWILTSYLVSSAIVMPLTGYFADRLGKKKYLLICIAGFVVTSALCGAAHTITELVIFRLLQGAFGASLVPLSQAIMTDTFPPAERGSAMAIWGIGVMVGPILGPTLGGYITEVSSWRWNFYINLPVGIISFILAWYTLTESEIKQRKMDWFGLTLIAIAIAAAQFCLDRGTQDDWFEAASIRFSATLAICCFIGFLIYCLNGRLNSVFDLRVFRDRNFTLSSLILAVFGLGLFGTTAILPMMLENLLNYPVLMTGLIMAPRGISGMISMMFVGKLIRRYDPRILITVGVFLLLLGTWIGTSYSLMINSFWIVWPLLLQGFGLGLVFVPLSTVAFVTLPDDMRAEAAGIFSLLRTIGSSIGISIVASMFARHSQMAWNQIGGSINPYNPNVNAYLHNLHLQPTDPAAITLLAQELGQQAQMVSFVNVFAFITWSFVIMLPLIFLIKNNRVNQMKSNLVVE